MAVTKVSKGQDLLNTPSRFEAILFSARRRAAGLVVLSQGSPTQQWAKSVKSEGRRNGFDLEAKIFLQSEPHFAANILARYLRHFDASKVYLIGLAPEGQPFGQEREDVRTDRKTVTAA